MTDDNARILELTTIKDILISVAAEALVERMLKKDRCRTGEIAGMEIQIGMYRSLLSRVTVGTRIFITTAEIVD